MLDRGVAALDGVGQVRIEEIRHRVLPLDASESTVVSAFPSDLESVDIPVSAGPASVTITPDGKPAFVSNLGTLSTFPVPGSIGTVSTIDVKTRRKKPDDVTVGAQPGGLAASPDGKTVFVPNYGSDTVSTIDVKTRTKTPDDIPVGSAPVAIAVTPCRR
jgi:YVTN family beta-propeller protein